MNIREKRKAADPELTADIAPPHWTVVVFSSRESLESLESLDIVLRTLKAAKIAATSTAAIDVLVNGNSQLAFALANHLDSPEVAHEVPPIRVWNIAVGDKANAWNQYIHQIWAGEHIAFFIDGYVRLNPNPIRLLGEAIGNQAEVLGGTAVPNVGRVRRGVRTPTPQNGFHGNFCCIKGTAIEQMRRRKISLPTLWTH